MTKLATCGNILITLGNILDFLFERPILLLMLIGFGISGLILLMWVAYLGSVLAAACLGCIATVIAFKW